MCIRKFSPFSEECRLFLGSVLLKLYLLCSQCSLCLSHRYLGDKRAWTGSWSLKTVAVINGGGGGGGAF